MPVVRGRAVQHGGAGHDLVCVHPVLDRRGPRHSWLFHVQPMPCRDLRRRRGLQQLEPVHTLRRGDVVERHECHVQRDVLRLPGRKVLANVRGAGPGRVWALQHWDILAGGRGIGVSAVRGRIFSGGNRAERVQRLSCRDKGHDQGSRVAGRGVHALPGGDVQRRVWQQRVCDVPESQRVAGRGREVHAGAGVLHEKGIAKLDG